MHNECGRCEINCSEYVSGSTAKPEDFISSKIDIEEIEAIFNETQLPKDIMDIIPPEIREGIKKSPIKEPKQACYEALAIFCCNDLNYNGYIFYNTDRIKNYSDNLANSIIVSTLSTMIKLSPANVNMEIIRLLRHYEWREKFLTLVRNTVRFVVTNSIILHERFHWAEGCGADKCEGEAKATAYSIKKVINIVTGKKLKNWEVPPPILSLVFPNYFSYPFPHLFWIRDVIVPSDYLSALFALELSIEALVLMHSKMPCYSNFHKYLNVRERMGSIKTTFRFKDVELPWIGISIALHYHDPFHAHIHGINLKDNVYLKQIANISPGKKGLKELWGCCKD